MTALLKPYGAINGPAARHTPIILSAADFSVACLSIVETLSGDAAHRALDELVTSLLTSLGYGDGMAIFLEAVRDKHIPGDTP